MRKNIRANRILIWGVLALIMSVAAPAQPAYTAGPPNVISNPGFVGGLSYWTNDGLPAWVWQSDGNVTVSGLEFGMAYLNQCIEVKTPPTGNLWTLAVLGSATNATGNATFYFYNGAGCTGTTVSVDPFIVNFGSGPMNQEAVGVVSIFVQIECYPGIDQPGECTLNYVSAGGDGATELAFLDLKAHQASPWERIYAWLRGLIWR